MLNTVSLEPSRYLTHFLSLKIFGKVTVNFRNNTNNFEIA